MSCAYCGGAHASGICPVGAGRDRGAVMVYGAPSPMSGTPRWPVVQPSVDPVESMKKFLDPQPVLAPCTKCQRHILSGTECPFCFATKRDAAVDELAPLREALAAARAKHPEGSNLAAVCSELGELADEMLAERISPQNVRSEALDVAVTALRIALGEVKS